MSTVTSPSSNRVYGVQRVCRAWDIARSTYYDWVARKEPPNRPGPKPQVPDEQVLTAIQQDLASSPFKGEGHRKVHARLRRRGIRIGKKRVLELMRSHRLLSPHRRPNRPQKKHDGTITTEEPNKQWGTDGTKIFTLRQGWVWLFTVVEHWNAECLGFHVAKHGKRFAALTPLNSAVMERFGSVARGAAEGLELLLGDITRSGFLRNLGTAVLWRLGRSGG